MQITQLVACIPGLMKTAIRQTLAVAAVWATWLLPSDATAESVSRPNVLFLLCRRHDGLGELPAWLRRPVSNAKHRSPGRSRRAVHECSMCSVAGLAADRDATRHFAGLGSACSFSSPSVGLRNSVRWTADARLQPHGEGRRISGQPQHAQFRPVRRRSKLASGGHAGACRWRVLLSHRHPVARRPRPHRLHLEAAKRIRHVVLDPKRLQLNP